MMRPLLLSLVVLAGCGDSGVLVNTAIPDETPTPVAKTEVISVLTRVDSGTPPVSPYAGPDGPPCCDSAGARLTSASCTAGICTCSTGTFCLCAGAPAAFACSDFCGSDAFIDAQCTAEGWSCGSGMVRTDSCAAGTCWGEPGDCCVNPSCVDGAWQCSEIADGGGCW